MKDEKALGALHTLRKYCRQRNCSDCIFFSPEKICYVTSPPSAPAYWDFDEIDKKVNGTKEED